MACALSLHKFISIKKRKKKDVPHLALELIRLHPVWLHIRETLVTVYLKCLSPSMRTLTFASIFFLHGSTHGMFHGFLLRGSHLLEEMAMLDAEFGGGGGEEGGSDRGKEGGREGRREGAKEEEGEVCVCVYVCKQDVKFNLQEKGSEGRDK